MHARIRTQAYLVGALPLAFLILLLVLGLMVQSASQAGGALEQHAQNVLAKLDATHAQIQEASRAAIGPSSKSAAGLRAARVQIAAELADLRSMTADDAGMPAAIAVLSRDLHTGLDVLDRYALLMRAGRAGEARALGDAPGTRVLASRLSSEWESATSRERSDELAKLMLLRAHVGRYEIALIVACVVGIVLTLFVSGRFGLAIAKRLGHLAENARRLARGEEASPLLGNDEFSDLDLVYQAMMRQIAREQRLNARLQAMLLPQQLPSFDGIRIDTSYVPAAQETEVGGDWYDAFAVSEHCICISIGDVAGHGLRAAAVMASARLTVRTAARMQTEPAEIVGQLNRVLCADEPGTLVTAVVAMLDIEDGTLRYAVAGHPEPMVIHANGATEMLTGRGLVLGADADARYETFETRLREGWALLLYTDGLIEITKDYFAGVDELRKAGSEEYAGSGHNIAEAIQQRVFHGRHADDDSAVLFVGITRLGAAHPLRQNWTLDARDAESAHRAKRAILWHLGDSIRDEAQLASIELVLGELIGNVARHSPGVADVTLERLNGHTLLSVADRGKPFTYNGNGMGDPLAESGRGLFIVRTMTHDLRIEHNGTGNVITAVLEAAN